MGQTFHMIGLPDGAQIRPFLPTDLPDAFELQLQSYEAFLIDPMEAFASRLCAPASHCMVATIDGVLAGYLLAHGWPARSPPPIGVQLTADALSEVLYIHDLCVAPFGRRMKIGQMMVMRAFELAVHDGFRTAELIAVDGAAGFWSKLGFVAGAVDPTMAAKISAYGSNAMWMTCNFVQ